MSANQAKILHNIGYEWWMFRSANAMLDLLDSDGHDPMRNALVEALVLHGRNLIDFFFVSSNAPGRSDDWTSKILGINRVPIARHPVLEVWRQEANRHVLHLTEARIKQVATWPSGEVARTLEEKIGELLEAAEVKLPPDWIGDWPAESKVIVGQGPFKVLGPHPGGDLTGPTGPTRPD